MHTMPIKSIFIYTLSLDVNPPTHTTLNLLSFAKTSCFFVLLLLNIRFMESSKHPSARNQSVCGSRYAAYSLTNGTEMKRHSDCGGREPLIDITKKSSECKCSNQNHSFPMESNGNGKCHCRRRCCFLMSKMYSIGRHAILLSMRSIRYSPLLFSPMACAM